jgi:hypothetical protein
VRITKASIGPFASIAVLVLVASGCSKGQASAAAASSVTQATAGPSPRPDCRHAACGDDFFIDTVLPDCAAGAACSVTLKLFATGQFHINDEYPYRFRADDAPGVAFLGTDAAGKNVFSKPAGDWQKVEAKAGAMKVSFSPAAPGDKTIAGTFKLSVCSPQSCLIEEPRISAAIAAK